MSSFLKCGSKKHAVLVIPGEYPCFEAPKTYSTDGLTEKVIPNVRYKCITKLLISASSHILQKTWWTGEQCQKAHCICMIHKKVRYCKSVNIAVSARQRWRFGVPALQYCFVKGIQWVMHKEMSVKMIISDVQVKRRHARSL